jgi:hypothetical protein
MQAKWTSLAVVLLLAGCASRDPLDQIVSVPTVNRFAAWRAHVASDSSASLRARVEEALQELRLEATGKRELQRHLEERVESGTAVIDEAVRSRVHGCAVREVLRMGYGTRVRRLREELTGLEDAMKKNRQLITKPGDLESRHHLDALHERQLARVTKYREELAAAERELASLHADTAKPSKQGNR